MKVLVTGTNGQLGYDMVRVLRANKIGHLATDRTTMNLIDGQQVKSVIRNYQPNFVIHCAAYTAVDQADDDRDNCYNVNVLGTRYIAEACRDIDAQMVYISTDYVFDGVKKEPYTTEDTPNPINYYGETKYQGELEVQKILDEYFIVRTSWVFGQGGNNFVKSMLKLGASREVISVVADQIGSPTYTSDLARALLELIQAERYGIHHIANNGYCSWYEFAREIFNQTKQNIKVTPITTDNYPSKAKRPRNSRLKSTYIMPDWQEALNRYIKFQ